MAFSIALTLAQRDNLVSLQRTERYQSRTQGRLASGREVNEVTDDVFKYFAARALTSRSDDFDNYRVAIDQAITSIRSSLNTVEAVTRLLKQLKGVIQSAAGKTTVELQRLNATLAPTLQEIGNIIVDAQYQGVNLLRGGTFGAGRQGRTIEGALTVRFSERHTIAIDSHNLFGSTVAAVAAGGTNAAVIGNVGALDNTNYVTPAGTATRTFITYGSTGSATVNLTNFLRWGSAAANTIDSLSSTFGNNSRINGIVENIEGVLRNITARAEELGTFVGILQTRIDFTDGYVLELNKGSDKYTLADINQEGAYLVALETRQQLGINALRVSGRQQNSILSLFN